MFPTAMLATAMIPTDVLPSSIMSLRHVSHTHLWRAVPTSLTLLTSGPFFSAAGVPPRTFRHARLRYIVLPRSSIITLLIIITIASHPSTAVLPSFILLRLWIFAHEARRPIREVFNTTRGACPIPGSNIAVAAFEIATAVGLVRLLRTLRVLPFIASHHWMI